MHEDMNRCTASVRNHSKILAFLVWLRLQDAKNGKPVRPAFYEDNFISLLPGESRTVTIEFAGTAAPLEKARLVVDGWNIQSETFVP